MVSPQGDGDGEVSYAAMSESRPGIKHRKRKSCVCGGHNAKNAKSNPHHHGTRRRMQIRSGRKPK